MWSYHIFFIIVIKICTSELDKDHDDYLMSTYKIKCGTSPPSRRSSKSRIINGIPATQAYPWIVDVVNFVAYNPVHKPKSKFTPGVRCGGGLISHRVVLTAGHCVCIGILHPKDAEEWKVLETCRESSGAIEYNQNQKGVNEIHVALGKLSINMRKWVSYQPEFDPNLRAYLYRYVRPRTYDDMFHTFSENGDIAVIVNKGRPFAIASDRQNIVPICLPSPDAFNERHGFPVKTAGRGFRYEESKLDDSTGNWNPSSCTTNEGTMKTTENLNRRNFLPCKKPEDQMEETRMVNTPKDVAYCSQFLQNNYVNSFSIHDDLDLEDLEFVKLWKFKNGNSESCKNYYIKAKEAYALDMAAKDYVPVADKYAEFDEIVKRFQIQNKNDKEAIETCYNVKAVGQYGICQIDETHSPSGFQWGFCSRSCLTQNAIYHGLLRSNEPYEEATFEFLDIAPSSTLFSQQMPTHLQSIDKCVKSIVPRASTYIFSRTLDDKYRVPILFEKLEYKGAVQDDEMKHASGHVTTFSGDSGSPYWKYDASRRAIVVSIVTSKVGPKFDPRSPLSENPEMECNHKATKLTEEVVKWIKKKAGIPKGKKGNR